MATVAKWNTLGTRGSNIASTTLDSLANGSTSAFVTFDNSSNLDLNAIVEVALGSFTSTTGASFTLRLFPTGNAGSTVPDATGSVGGGEIIRTIPITVGASAKVAVFILSGIPPVSCRVCITNNGGAAFASSGNSLIFTPFNEQGV